MSTDQSLANVPHAAAVQEVIRSLGTDANSGLSSDEAAQRLERYGRNELAQPLDAARLEVARTRAGVDWNALRLIALRRPAQPSAVEADRLSARRAGETAQN